MTALEEVCLCIGGGVLIALVFAGQLIALHFVWQVATGRRRRRATEQKQLPRFPRMRVLQGGRKR